MDVCGWQGQARVLGGHLPSQLRLVHEADGWWIGIDAFAPYLRVQLCAGRITDGIFADVSAFLDGTVNAPTAKSSSEPSRSCASAWRPRSRRTPGPPAATASPSPELPSHHRADSPAPLPGRLCS